jgi:nitronate monooxygenase
MVTITAHDTTAPWLIQGGMGIAISGWALAHSVAAAGQLGVVSGTAIDTVFARRLQDLGVDDDLGEVLDTFPVPAIVEDALSRYTRVRRVPGTPYLAVPMLGRDGPQRVIDLVVLASFVEVALAKRGHDGTVGINLLTKVQLPTAASLYGAMLAGVDYVLMGAGVPTHIPGVLEDLSRARRATLPVNVSGASSDDPVSSLTFDPAPYGDAPSLRRPKFVGIVASHVLASALLRRSNGPVDGFVVERPSAGGHNAPPRGARQLDDRGQPLYGPRDDVDYDVLRELGVPFWIGGGVTSSRDVRDAQDLGAAGVQVGTMFAYCRESGMDPDLRQRVLAQVAAGSAHVTTSVTASSTGYPFKVVEVPASVTDPATYRERPRRCDLGYLREAYFEDGSLSYRCGAEPLHAFQRKGGDPASAEQTVCLCNGLMATCGLAQVRASRYVEPPLVTSGDRLNDLAGILADHTDYGALDVLHWLDPAASA